MHISNIYSGFLQFRRFFQIVKIIVKHAFSEWYGNTRMGRRRAIKREPQMKVHTTQERIRITIEELGPTYIKFGQILADRPDMISEKLRYELKKLQSGAVAMPDNQAIKLIEEELGRTLESVFEEFDHHCLASASIGQVYKAKLIDAEEVIIKIQRPYIEEKIKLDIYVMSSLASWLAKNYPEMAAINVKGLIKEFGDNMLKELDYFNEASNMIAFQQMFKDDPTVHIPKVYMEYTTKRIIVQERIKGITPDKIDDLRAAGLDTDQIAENGARAMLEMILGHGFFHADPHAGNMFILPNNVIGLIDFGMVGELRPRDLNFLASFTMAFVGHDTRAMAESLVTLCGLKFFDRIEELEFDLRTLMRQYEHLDIEKIDFSGIIQSCINIIVKYEMQIPSGIFMLAKSLGTIQKVAEALNPNVALIPIIKPYAIKILKDRFDPKSIAKDIFHVVSDYLTLIKTLPSDISEILYKLKTGHMKHDIDLNTGDLAKQLGRRISFVLLLIGLFIGSAFLTTVQQDMRYAQFLLYVSSGIILLYLVKWLFSKK